MEYRINGFDQIKAFYSAVFEQKYDIKPQHISLYVFLINQNNRNNWVEWFKCPYDLAMAGACIGNKRTYYKCLDELQEWKFIQYQKGVNNWKAPKIKLEVLKCTTTDTASVPQSEPLLPQAVIPTPQQLLPLIYKHITSKEYNNKQLIRIKEIIDIILIGESKPDKESIDNVYNSYPSKCPVKGSSTGKAIKDKDKIKSLLSNISEEKLINTIEWYITECKKSKTFMKNFKTFLNNLPDLDESKPSQENKIKKYTFSCSFENRFISELKAVDEQGAKDLYMRDKGIYPDKIVKL